MPGKIKVKVLAGRNLPVMDRAGDTTDAFVEIKFGSVTHKTDVCRKSLNPHWNSTEWYRFEVDESELQDEPLQLRLMDHDTYSANDAIGKVVISLAPLLAREANNAKSTTAPHGGAVMSGWIPVFDTMHGIRGELNVIVKVELFSDFNKYKTSSCGVQFFHCPMIPPGYRATAIHGFVEELVVNDDPEYQWIDKIRTPRASNEARQVAFIKLSNQVQRLVGLKAAELGANAVVGYQQEFDLEGEAGVVARAIGTAVTIHPLPTPSQPSNMPACTQQQLKKYLDILATNKESVSDFNQYYLTHQDELQKMLVILGPNASSLLDETDPVDDDDKSMDLTRQSSITSYAGSISLYQDDYNLHHKSLRHLSEDQTDLNKLLNKDSDDSDSSGPIQKIKKIKTNFFTKRFGSIRSKKSNSDKQDDQISLRSNSSETSRLSLADIKNEFKKFKRLKKPKMRKQFVNEGDQGEGMVSILARSVIHAHTSLACIAETQDSEHSPGSTMRRTSESEPTMNTDDDRNKKEMENIKEDVQPPEIRCTSLNNISSDDTSTQTGRQRKLSESCPATPMPDRSENLLTLPGEVGYFGSVSSALSAESSEIESETSDEDDESSDLRTDTERSIETTSSVVKSVLSHNVNPNFINQMDRKLSILEHNHPDQSTTKQQETKQSHDKKIEVEQQVFDNQQTINKCKSLESVPHGVENKKPPVKSNEASTSSVKEETCVTKPSHHIKFHNPFAHKKACKSISAPCSPVEKDSFVNRSSRRIRRQFSKLSKNRMIKSISHYSLRPKAKEIKQPLSQPGSSSDVDSKAPSETVLGSPFLSYNDLLSLDKEGIEPSKFFHKSDEFDRAKVSMYIGSEPVSRASLSLSGSLYPYPGQEIHDHHKKAALKPTGLVHTAMETILLDKVQSLMIPTTPDVDSKTNKKFFDDVTEKLGKVEQLRNSRSVDNIRNNVYQRSTSRPQSHSPPIDNKPCIINSATIYKNKHNNEYGELSTPDFTKPEYLFKNDDERHDTSKSKIKKPLHLIHSLLGQKSPEPTSPTEKLFKKRELKPTGMVHTAMEAMLMERVQSVLPETPQTPLTSVFDDYDRQRYEESTKKYGSSSGLVDSAFETSMKQYVSDDYGKKRVKSKDEAKGLTHMAMETMLLDRVQASALGANVDPNVSASNEYDNQSVKSKDTHKDEEVKGLTHMAMEAMLLDRVQTSALGSNVDPTLTVSSEHDNQSIQSKDIGKDHEVKGLTHMAMETMLLDRVQASALGAHVDATMPAELDGDNQSVKSKDVIKDEEVKGLTQMAMQAMLLDRVHTSALGANVDPTISAKEEHDNLSIQSKDTGKDQEVKGLTHMAIETMLLDRAQASALGVNVGAVISIDDCSESEKNKETTDEQVKGLTHTAIKTMLLDRVQTSALGTYIEPVVPVDESKTDMKPNKDSHEKSLTHTAVESILMDKINSLVGPSDMTFVEPNFTNEDLEQADRNAEELKSPGLVKSAVQTMFLDKVQTMVGHNDFSFQQPKEFDKEKCYDEYQHKPSADENQALSQPEGEIPTEALPLSPGLINTALQTMLIDTAQSLLPPSSEEDIETQTKTPKMSEKSKSAEKNVKKLIRQDSVHSIADETPKMSKVANTISSDVTKPYYHPMLGELETIPSLPEGSIDVDETNNSVCGNSHAVCRANRERERREDRREREREKEERDRDRGSPRHARHESYGGRDPVPTSQTQNSSLNASSTPMGIHRRSSDSDLSVTPKGGSLNTSAGNVGSGGGAILRPSMNSNNLDMLEYPFLTMTEFPPGFIVHIGGTVCARSVRLADGEGGARAASWAELRTELRAHARALRCNAVLAYTDTASICEDVCVLSASGTAAVINLDCDFNADPDVPITVNTGSKNAIDDMETECCSMAHVPYSPGAGPYRAELSSCGGCRRARVPTVLLATCSKPNRLAAYPKAITLTAVASRTRRAPPTSEPGARDISDQLPFLEYELHKLLLAKLRMQGANALFSLQTQIAIGERCVMALASGTAVRLTALPPPTPPRIKASENDKDALEIQKALWDSFAANRAENGYDVGGTEYNTNGVLPEVEGEDAPTLDLCADKDACVLELDEAEDVETARALAKRHVNMQVYTPGLKPVIGAAPHAFTQVCRGRVGGGGARGAGERAARRALSAAAYKLRRLQPAALAAPAFRLELPDDEIQLVVSGAAIPLQDPNSTPSGGSSQSGDNSGEHDDDIFALDEEQLVKQPEVMDEKGITGQVPATVSLTSLSLAPGARCSVRVCALRLLFVRETTAVRELGGLSGFLHTFTCEVLAIVRAYTAALGGNALTSFYITQLMLQDNAHKNQGQCLLSVGGDVVHVTY